MSQPPERIKCWVACCDDYPGGIIFENRADALESSHTCRSDNCKAYVRVKYFTQQQLDELPEAG